MTYGFEASSRSASSRRTTASTDPADVHCHHDDAACATIRSASAPSPASPQHRDVVVVVHAVAHHRQPHRRHHADHPGRPAGIDQRPVTGKAAVTVPVGRVGPRVALPAVDGPVQEPGDALRRVEEATQHPVVGDREVELPARRPAALDQRLVGPQVAAGRQHPGAQRRVQVAQLPRRQHPDVHDRSPGAVVEQVGPRPDRHQVVDVGGVQHPPPRGQHGRRHRAQPPTSSASSRRGAAPGRATAAAARTVVERRRPPPSRSGRRRRRSRARGPPTRGPAAAAALSRAASLVAGCTR